MANQPILYSYFRSSCSWRVRIALAYKNIDYDIKPVNLIKDGGQQHTEEFIKLNPMEQVPVYYENGHTLTQSASIIEYLEETRPNPPLLPSDPFQRAKVRALCECIGSGIQPLQNLAALLKLDKSERDEWPKFWISKGLKAYEDLIQSTAGKYSFGNEVTMADCYLVPQIYNANRFGVNLTPYPTVNKVVEELEKLEAFQASHPKNQPDTPPDMK